MSAFLKFTQFVQKTFAIWVLLFAAIAMVLPEVFVWLKAYIPWMLGIIMLGMGMTMTVGDFKSVLQSPKAVMIGVLAQFMVMPGLAYALCKLLQLPTEIAIGVILVGCCPGGKRDYLYGKGKYRIVSSLYFRFDVACTNLYPRNFLCASESVA